MGVKYINRILQAKIPGEQKIQMLNDYFSLYNEEDKIKASNFTKGLEVTYDEDNKIQKIDCDYVFFSNDKRLFLDEDNGTDEIEDRIQYLTVELYKIFKIYGFDINIYSSKLQYAFLNYTIKYKNNELFLVMYKDCQTVFDSDESYFDSLLYNIFIASCRYGNTNIVQFLVDNEINKYFTVKSEYKRILNIGLNTTIKLAKNPSNSNINCVEFFVNKMVAENIEVYVMVWETAMKKQRLNVIKQIIKCKFDRKTQFYDKRGELCGGRPMYNSGQICSNIMDYARNYSSYEICEYLSKNFWR